MGHQPKGSARILDVGDVKETVYYGYVPIKWQVTQNQPLGELIRQNNSPGDNHQLYIFVFQHIFLKGSGFRCKVSENRGRKTENRRKIECFIFQFLPSVLCHLTSVLWNLNLTPELAINYEISASAFWQRSQMVGCSLSEPTDNS